jgi:hypothetical protein
MSVVAKVKRFERTGELLDNAFKYQIAWREGNRPFGLHFEYGLLAIPSNAADDHIVKWMAFAGALQFDAIYPHAG